MEESKMTSTENSDLPTPAPVESESKVKKNLPRILLLLGLAVILVLLVTLNWRLLRDTYNGWFAKEVTSINKTIAKRLAGPLIDDWVYDQASSNEYSIGGSGTQGGSALFGLSPVGSLSMDSSLMGLPSPSNNLGFAVGGAKDINSFRKNIENDYLPLPTDITYEGLFYDYYFETGQKTACQKLFCPSYATAVSSDPVSSQNEYFLSVGLNSGLKEADFERKKLNLVIVLDISGSMGSSFDRYYYDGLQQQNAEAGSEDDINKTKLEIAAKAIVAMLDQLKAEDRLGIVLFDDNAYLAKPLNLVGETDIEATKNHILKIKEQGGTDMSAGIKRGTELFAEHLEQDKSEYENRIIFLTDAMPNYGETSEEGLLGLAKKNANNGIYTTFIGIGVDFNTELIEAVTKISGANYHSVHSSSEFTRKLADEFEYMVTPLVFDLTLALESSDFIIEEVYGSPEANEATGEIMRVNTLFPSKTQDGQTRGGLILLKLKKIGTGNDLALKTSYRDRQGVSGEDRVSVTLNDEAHYANTGIRKGIVLTRYANLIQKWATDMRKEKAVPYISTMPDYAYLVNEIDGLSMPYPIEVPLGQWERQSLPLATNAHYKQMFQLFSNYYNSETAVLADENMNQEKSILEKLSNL